MACLVAAFAFSLFAFRAAENFINIQIVSLIEIYC